MVYAGYSLQRHILYEGDSVQIPADHIGCYSLDQFQPDFFVSQPCEIYNPLRIKNNMSNLKKDGPVFVYQDS